jgi:hypothetical protein
MLPVVVRPVDLALYVGGFRTARERFTESRADWRVAFAATFETLIWTAAIREHLNARYGFGYVARESVHLEGAYCVRNFLVHVLPRRGGEAPYLAFAIESHGTSLANSLTTLGFQADAFQFGPVVGHLHDTWSGLETRSRLQHLAEAQALEDVEEWRWQPRSEWPEQPESPNGKDEYDSDLAHELVASTFAAISDFVDRLA